eukprot:scpid81452/ scgid3236/ 
MHVQARQSQAYLSSVVPAEFRSCAQAISASGSPESSPEMASRMEERISSRISWCCCLKTTHDMLAVDTVTSRTTLQKIRTTLLILQAKVLKQICLHRKVSLLFSASKAASPTLAHVPFSHAWGRCTMTAGVADCLRGAGRECFCGMITLVCPLQTYIYHPHAHQASGSWGCRAAAAGSYQVFCNRICNQRIVCNNAFIPGEPRKAGL